MNKMFRILLGVTFYLCAFSALFTVPVKAYIDPSATTYIIQAVAAVVIAIGAAFTIFRHKIASLFKKDNADNKKEIIMKDVEEDK